MTQTLAQAKTFVQQLDIPAAPPGLLGATDEPLNEAAWRTSREFLGRARSAYSEAFEADLQSHWLGVHQLALDAVLTGRINRPEDWLLVARAAEAARDHRPDTGKMDYWSCAVRSRSSR